MHVCVNSQVIFRLETSSTAANACLYVQISANLLQNWLQYHKNACVNKSWLSGIHLHHFRFQNRLSTSLQNFDKNTFFMNKSFRYKKQNDVCQAKIVNAYLLHFISLSHITHRLTRWRYGFSQSNLPTYLVKPFSCRL